MPDANDLIFEFRAPSDKLKTDLADARGEVRKFGSDVEGDVSSFAERVNGLLGSVGSKLNTGLKIALGDFGTAVDSLVSITEAGLRGIPVVGEGIAAAYHEVSGTLLDATQRGLAYNDSLRQQQIQLGLVAKDAAEVKRELTEIGDIAFRTNVGRGFLANAVEDLQLFNVEGQRALDLERALAIQATATGGGEGRASALTDLIERVLETGKFDTRTVRQFIRQKVPIYDIFAEELQLSKQEVIKKINSGAFSGDDLITVLTHAFTGPKWTQAAEEMTQTVGGLTQRYNAAVNKLLGIATQPIHATTVDFLRQAVDAVRGPGAAGAATSIQSAISPVTSLLEQVGGALKSGDIFGGAVSAGNSIVSGLEKGIEEKTSVAVDAVKGLGTAGINALNDVWDSHSPSQVAADIGGMVVEGFAHGKGGRGGLASEESKQKLRKAVEELLQEPAIQSFLKIIQRSELGAGERDPYSRAFGHGGHIDPNTLDPSGSNWYGERVFSPTLGRSVMTHAFGAYQFEPGTFRSLARQLGLTDVSPQSQDMAAVLDLLRHRGAVPSIMGGDVRGAMSKTSGEWESFALRLRRGQTGDLQTLFNQLTVGGSPISPSNPMPVSVVSGDLTGGVGVLARQPAPADQSAPTILGHMVSKEDLDLTAGLKEMADSVSLVGSHAKDSGLYIEGIGDVAQKEVVPALVIMGQLMAEDAQAAQNFGQSGGDALEKLRGRVHSLGESFREMGFTAANISKRLSDYFGGALLAGLRHDWHSFFSTLEHDAEDFLVRLAKQEIQQGLLKLFSPKQGVGTDNGGEGGGGFTGLLKGLFGLGSSAAAAPAAASVVGSAGALGGSAGMLAGLGVGAGGLGAALAAGIGGGGAAAGGLGAAAAGSMGGAAAGGSSLAGLGALLTNPWTIGIAAGIVGGIELFHLIGHRHKSEKALRKAINDSEHVDIKEMSVLTQIKQIGEAAFGRGQVPAHLGEVIQLPDVQQIIDDYAARTGQGKPTLPHMFTYNQLGGPTSPPITVSGNTLLPSSASGTMPSPFSGASPRASQYAPSGAPPVVQTDPRLLSVLHTLAQSVAYSTKVMSRIEGISPEQMLTMGLQTSGGARASANATLTHLETTPAAARRLQRSAGVDRM
jgi:muramidase (phage lysozyme)